MQPGKGKCLVMHHSWPLILTLLRITTCGPTTLEEGGSYLRLSRDSLQNHAYQCFSWEALAQHPSIGPIVWSKTFHDCIAVTGQSSTVKIFPPNLPISTVSGAGCVNAVDLAPGLVNTPSRASLQNQMPRQVRAPCLMDCLVMDVKPHSFPKALQSK